VAVLTEQPRVRWKALNAVHLGQHSLVAASWRLAGERRNNLALGAEERVRG
jgi:hypothetical protein